MRCPQFEAIHKEFVRPSPLLMRLFVAFCFELLGCRALRDQRIVSVSSPVDPRTRANDASFVGHACDCTGAQQLSVDGGQAAPLEPARSDYEGSLCPAIRRPNNAAILRELTAQFDLQIHQRPEFGQTDGPFASLFFLLQSGDGRECRIFLDRCWVADTSSISTGEGECDGQVFAARRVETLILILRGDHLVATLANISAESNALRLR